MHGPSYKIIRYRVICIAPQSIRPISITKEGCEICSLKKLHFATSYQLFINGLSNNVALSNSDYIASISEMINELVNWNGCGRRRVSSVSHTTQASAWGLRKITKTVNDDSSKCGTFVLQAALPLKPILWLPLFTVTLYYTFHTQTAED
jgi:hypothetical protein